MITIGQCKAARALMGWSRGQLAEAAGLNERSIYDFERGARKPMRSTLAVIQQALEKAGVVFIDENGGGAGVRLKTEPRR